MTPLGNGRALARLGPLAILVLAAIWLGTIVTARAGSQNGGGSTNEASAPKPPSRVFNQSLGAILTTNSPGWSAVLEGNQARGVLALRVLPGTASATGLRPGDVITSIDETPLSGEEQLGVIFRQSTSAKHEISFVKPTGKTFRTSITLVPPEHLSFPDFLRRQFETRRDPVTRFLFAQSTPSAALSLAVAKSLTIDAPDFQRAHALLAGRLADRYSASNGRTADAQNRTALKQNAIFEIKRSLELDPTAAKMHEIAADIFLSVGETRQAEAEALAAIATDPQAGRAQNALGRVRLTLGRPADAVAPLRQAISLDPFLPDSYRSLARAYSATGKTPESDLTLTSLRALETSLSKASAVQPPTGKVSPSVGLAALAVIALGYAASRFRKLYDPFQTAIAIDRLKLTKLGALEGLAAAALASLAISIPYLGSFFGISGGQAERIELIGHFLPGLILLALTIVSLVRWPHPADLLPGIVPVSGLLLGVWMTATQIRLFRQALSGLAGWPKVMLHFTPGLAALALAAWLLLGADEMRKPAPSAKHSAAPGA